MWWRATTNIPPNLPSIFFRKAQRPIRYDFTYVFNMDTRVYHPRHYYVGDEGVAAKPEARDHAPMASLNLSLFDRDEWQQIAFTAKSHGTRTWSSISRARAKKPTVSVGFTRNQKRYTLHVRRG